MRGVRERKEWGDTAQAGKGGEDKGGDEDGIEVEWGCWLQGGTCHNDKPGLNSGGDWGRV